MYIDKRFSGEIGKEYQLFKLSVPHHGELQNLIKDLIKKFVVKKKAKEIEVVECGTGIGYTTLRIIEASKKIKLVSVDNELVMQEQAINNLSKFSKRITYVNNDILSYLKTLEDKSVEIFVSAMTIHNFEEQYRLDIFSEIGRALKPGGLFINGDIFNHQDRMTHVKNLTEQILAFDEIDKVGRKDLKEFWIHHYLEDELKRMTIENQIGVLAKVGIKASCTYTRRMEAIVAGNKKS